MFKIIETLQHSIRLLQVSIQRTMWQPMHLSRADEAMLHQQLNHLCAQLHTAVRHRCGDNDAVNGIGSVDLIRHQPRSGLATK